MSSSASPNNKTKGSLLDRRVVRRFTLIPLAAVVSIVVVVLSPLLLLCAAVVDLVTRQPRWRYTRLVYLLAGTLLVELIGLLTSLVMWILTGFGFVGTARWRWHMHRYYMGRYTDTLLRHIARVLGTSIQWKEEANLDAGPVVFIARHTSFFDALIPATVLARHNQLLPHHVVTRGLQFAPCIDIVGHRFPTRFIRRSSAGADELEGIRQLGEHLDERSAAIIFPEGTFRSPERFKRVMQSLQGRDPELATRAAKLQHVLPPRSAGTFALLAGSPAADIVICTNTGFEPFGTVRQIMDKPWADRPIIIETTRIARADVPSEPTAFAEWLLEQFEAIDAWADGYAGSSDTSANTTGAG